MLGTLKTLFVEVILPLPIEKLYTYRVPQELNDEVLPGKRVAVHFRGKKVYAALIRNIRTKPPSGYQASYVLQVIDSEPIIHDREFELWEWISSYYLAPIGDVMNVALPAGLKLKNDATLIASYEELPPDLDLDEKEQILLQVLEEKKSIKLDEIPDLLGIKSGLKYLKSLHEKGLISILDNIKERYASKLVKGVSLSPEFANQTYIEALLPKLEKRSPKQVNVILALLQTDTEFVPKQAFVKKHNLSASSVNTLVKNGLVIEKTIRIDRIRPRGMAYKELELSSHQNKALDKILKSFSNKKPVLLKGASYSGKSHLFSFIAKHIIENGKQALYLLPEIALTEEFHSRLQQYFGNQMVSFHSKYNQHERVELWDKVKSSEAKLIVGPRNAVLLPFADLGLIIVDEEHENSYKQQQRNPKFHARDVALYLAKKWESDVVLGSATPSIESYYLAQRGFLDLVTLDEAYNSKPKPIFHPISTSREKKVGRMKSLLSDTLYEALRDNFEENKKAILFQNRKGYVPITACNVCDWSQKCINCDITLTYYKYSNNLRCHYCGYHEYPVSNCPNCGSKEILTQGAGTEKIAEELQLLFPEQSIERFDQESTRGKNKVQKLLSDFREGNIDALVGTQLIAKGMAFTDVNLAAIVSADQILNFPDFRAHERAFQLFTQLSGRVGSEEKPGMVYVQISQPEHPILKYVMENDYTRFYEMEIMNREQFRYPPFTRLLLIQLRHKNPSTVEQAARQFAHYLKSDFGDKVLGPESPHISRIRNQFIQQILIKIDRETDHLGAMKKRISDLGSHLKSLKDFRSVRIDYNVDPQ